MLCAKPKPCNAAYEGDNTLLGTGGTTPYSQQEQIYHVHLFCCILVGIQSKTHMRRVREQQNYIILEFEMCHTLNSANLPCASFLLYLGWHSIKNEDVNG